MSKKKPAYSLTAKERKERRRAEQEKALKKNKATPEVEPAEAAAPVEGGEAVAPEQKPSKKSLWILIVAVTVGLILILLAVILPFVIKNDNSKYPRAVIKLSDGRTIEMVLWEDECPIAATNFIFLAKIGFFNGTMIYDVKPDRNYMRIGNFTGYGSTDNKTDNADFMASIPRSILNVTRLEELENGKYVEKANTNKLGYYLKKDTSSYANLYKDPFVVSYNNNRNSADFVINLGENNENFTPGVDASYLSAFASIEDEGSKQVLRDILAMEINDKTGLDNIYGTTPSIYIDTVTVTNLDNSKWKNFEFVSYMSKAYNGNSAFNGWVGSV